MLTVQQAFDLALRHHQAGQLAEAEGLYRQILGVQPRHAGALRSLGVIAHQGGRHDLAVELIRQSISLDSNSPAAHCNIAEAYRAAGRFDEAIAACHQALILKPDLPAACNNLSAALIEQCRFEEAVAAACRALQIKPNCAEAHNNLGTALVELGQLGEAIASFCRAIDLEPDYANAKFNYSILLLLQGDFEHGWPMYEARQKVFCTAEREFFQPRWDGGSLDQRRVLIHAEQGFGDSIQFIRYAELIGACGGEVVVECQRTLIELFRSVKGVIEIVAIGDAIPQFDLQIPMASLPFAFRTTSETIPRNVPYLFAEQTRRDAWRDRVGRSSSRLRVGFAWTGNPDKLPLRKRHVALEKLLPILQVDGVDFFSLQIGSGSEQIQGLLARGARITDHTKHIKDFADTAALMSELDLIISVDTAVAHLAGALGRPVWTLLPFVPDWRWGLEREDSPWYPTMRLFRQPTRGDWDSVIQRAAGELKHFKQSSGWI